MDLDPVMESVRWGKRGASDEKSVAKTTCKSLLL